MPAGSNGRHRKYWTLLAWVGVICCCALLWGAENGLRRRHQLADTEARDRRAKFTTLANTFYSYAGDPPSTIVAGLNHDQPLKPLPSPDGQAVRLEWDASHLGPQYAGWKVELTFSPAVPTVGTTPSHPSQLQAAKTTAPAAHYGTGPSYQALLAMEYARRVALLLAGAAWGLAILTMFFARPWRRPLAQVCLAAAVLAAVAWWVDPLRRWGNPPWRTPLPMAIGAGGLLALVALALPVRRRLLNSGQAPCPHCGYDLTGNVSGVCPECGRMTPQGRIDRWQELADRIETDFRDPEESADPPARSPEQAPQAPQETEQAAPTDGTRDGRRDLAVSVSAV